MLIGKFCCVLPECRGSRAPEVGASSQAGFCAQAVLGEPGEGGGEEGKGTGSEEDEG